MRGGLCVSFPAIEWGVRGGTNVFANSGLIAHAVGAASVRDLSRAKRLLRTPRDHYRRQSCCRGDKRVALTV